MKSKILVLVLLIFFEVGIFAKTWNDIPFEEENIIVESDVADISLAIAEQNTIIEKLKNSGEPLFQHDDAFYSEESVNETYYKRYGIIVKGSLNGEYPVLPPGTTIRQSVDDDKDYRIMGENTFGELIENPFYDPVMAGKMDEKLWIKNTDKEQINLTAIGKGLANNSPYSKEELVKEYYSNFITGFVEGFGDYLSDEFIHEYNEAKNKMTHALKDKDYSSLTDAERKSLDELFKDVGKGDDYPLADYIRIAALPTKHSNGVAYMFHRTPGGTYYYLSVLLKSDVSKYDNFGGISVLSSVGISSTSGSYKYGHYDFQIYSDKPIKSYEISYPQNGVRVDGELQKTFTSSYYDYGRTFDLSIIALSASRTIDIIIEATNIDGETARHTVSVSVVGLSNITPAKHEAVIASNKRNEEIFDVTQGIPTQKNIYASVTCPRYLADVDYDQVKSKIDFMVNVSRTYHLTWYPNGDDGPASTDTVTVSKSITVSRPYSYYKVNFFGIYTPKQCTLNGDFFENGGIQIDPAGEIDIDVDVIRQTVNMKNPLGKTSLSVSLSGMSLVGGRTRPGIPNEDFNPYAQAAVPELLVRNDAVRFEGITISGGDFVNTSTQPPVPIPVPGEVDPNFFYKEDILIPTFTQNGVYEPTGEVRYEKVININTSEELNREIEDINNVVIHSPVVCYADITSRIDDVQAHTVDESISQLIIGDTFDVNFPYSGQHKDIPGYGDRSYEDSTRLKQVRFSFDSYKGDGYSENFYKANTWIDVDKDVEQFFIPEWASETDNAIISFRAVANNLKDEELGVQRFELNHNLSIENYKAVEVKRAQLIGKIYDFEISFATDPAYETHFETGSGVFKVGDKDEFGNEERTDNNFPLCGEKIDDEKYLGRQLKLGYKIKFSFKTSGDMLGKDDIAIITPTYKLIDDEGNIRNIKLYHISGGKLIDIGNGVKREMVLYSDGRRIKKNEMKKTAYALSLQDRESPLTYEKYLKKLTSKKGIDISYNNKIILTEYQKTYIGEVTNPQVQIGDIISSKQKWYGEFYLPNNTFAVYEDTDLSTYDKLSLTDDVFIKEGVIVVNVKVDLYHDIAAISDIESREPYISYTTDKYGNQWEKEGFELTQQINGNEVELEYGDLCVYYAGQRAYNNYK